MLEEKTWFSLKCGISEEEMHDIHLNGKFANRKRDFRLNGGFPKMKTRDFGLNGGFSKMKMRDFRLNGGFPKRKRVIFA